MTSLIDKTALVTGASRGIGAAIARDLATRGAMVIMMARDAEACGEIAKKIAVSGGRVAVATCDVADYGQVEAVVEQAADLFGGIDILVNNAGTIDPIGLLDATDPEDWGRNVSVNLLGVYHGLRAVLPGMRANGGGVIVNVSSGAAHRPLEGWSAYCASKAAVAMLTRSVHLEAACDGIRIVGFGPGTVDTDMQVSIRASGINAVSEIPREDLAPVEHPAQVVGWLCSDEAADLAGQEVSIRDEEIRRRAGLEV